MATIWDVAERAGVSKSTVSLVLNRSPLVKEETRQRVLEAIKALNYVPNYNARSLIHRRTNSIGILHARRDIDLLHSPYEWDHSVEQFYHDVEESVCAAVVELNEELSVVKEHLETSSRDYGRAKIIRDRRVDGVIFISGFDDEQSLRSIQQIDLPVVLATSLLKLDGVDVVSHDPHAGTRLATEKLIETGHRRICLLNTPQHFRVWPTRVAGMREAAQAHGFPLDERLLISVERMTAHGAYQAFSALLDAGQQPDAVLTTNTDLALGVLRCLYERGIRVPEEISLICYEDSSICGNLSPALSAVNIHKEEIGRKALDFLLGRISHPEIPARAIAIEPHLVMRDSVIDRR